MSTSMSWGCAVFLLLIFSSFSLPLLHLFLPAVKDLLLLKATSAATLSCLGECLSMLQHNVVQALNQNQNQNHIPSLSQSSAGLNQAASTESGRLWRQRCKSSVNQVEPGGLRSSSQSLTHGCSESWSPKHGSYRGRQEIGHNYIQSQNQSQSHAYTGKSSDDSSYLM